MQDESEVRISCQSRRPGKEGTESANVFSTSPRRKDGEGSGSGDSFSAGGSGRSKRARICVLDSDGGYRDDVKKLLEAMDCEVLCLDTFIGASNLIRNFRPDVLVVDNTRLAVSGDQLVRTLRRNLHKLPVMIFYSSPDEIELARTAKTFFADDFIIKNGDFLILVNRIKYHINRMGR